MQLCSCGSDGCCFFPAYVRTALITFPHSGGNCFKDYLIKPCIVTAEKARLNVDVRVIGGGLFQKAGAQYCAQVLSPLCFLIFC